jgi:hypothetical protein
VPSEYSIPFESEKLVVSALIVSVGEMVYSLGSEEEKTSSDDWAELVDGLTHPERIIDPTSKKNKFLFFIANHNKAN